MFDLEGFAVELIELMRKHNLKSIKALNENFLISSEDDGIIQNGDFTCNAIEGEEVK
jgi:hypothetical protein